MNHIITDIYNLASLATSIKTMPSEGRVDEAADRIADEARVLSARFSEALTDLVELRVAVKQGFFTNDHVGKTLDRILNDLCGVREDEAVASVQKPARFLNERQFLLTDADGVSCLTRHASRADAEKAARGELEAEPRSTARIIWAPVAVVERAEAPIRVREVKAG